MRYSGPYAAAVALALGAALLAAPAWAGDCWLESVRHAGAGGAALGRVAARAATALRSDPAVQAIAEVRYQAHLGTDRSLHHGAPRSASAMAWLHRRESWVSRCGLQPWADNVHFARLGVLVNDLRPIVAEDGVDPVETPFFEQPEITARHAGFPIYEGRLLLMTHQGLPPFVPVTRGEYLERWQRTLQQEGDAARAGGAAVADDPAWRAYVAQLRRTDPRQAAELETLMADAARQANASNGDAALDASGEWAELQRLRRALTPAERARPVYVSAAAVERWRFGMAEAGEAGARAMVKVNPALWAGAGAQDVRTVALEVALSRTTAFEAVDDAQEAGVLAWLRHVDLRPYQALLEVQ